MQVAATRKPMASAISARPAGRQRPDRGLREQVREGGADQLHAAGVDPACARERRGPMLVAIGTAVLGVTDEHRAPADVRGERVRGVLRCRQRCVVAEVPQRSGGAVVIEEIGLVLAVSGDQSADHTLLGRGPSLRGRMLERSEDAVGQCRIFAKAQPQVQDQRLQLLDRADLGDGLGQQIASVARMLPQQRTQFVVGVEAIGLQRQQRQGRRCRCRCRSS